MSSPKKSIIEVQGTAITILSGERGDYISLTDTVRHFDGGGALIEQWLKNKDGAFEFGSWLSPEFKLYLIKEFQRLKDDENRLKVGSNENHHSRRMTKSRTKTNRNSPVAGGFSGFLLALPGGSPSAVVEMQETCA
jgi:hypothetical protein